ncbi:hypothetical protein [Streptomyces sp. NPDC058084]|uniref:hypothetical protein n=1 Tax=Streptomyces sp. NPDC058084 TaxID=3346333 RepID=UPI0036F12AF4
MAGGGRTGGDTTRQWAPKLITAGLVVITYKPILAIIICTGFAEFGHSKTLAEWLRGVATLLLGVIAPGPLTRIFAPFGEAVGAGMASGGASGALGAAAGYIGGKAGGDSDSGGGGGDAPVNAVQHAQFVEQQMGKQGQGQEGGQGGDAQAQAARNEATANIPAQAGPEGVAGATQTATTTGTATGTATTVAAGTATAGVALGVQVLDGINDGIQGAAGQIGGGGNQQ